MSNIDEQLSAFMDGEESNLNLVLSKMQDQNVRTRWQHYHLIRDIMRNQVSKVDNQDISLRIHDAIAKEPTSFAPANLRHRATSRIPFLKQLGSMAIAATVTAVAILVVQQNPDSSTQSTVIASKTSQSHSIQTASTRNIELNKAVAAKLNSYLVNHNEYAVSSGMQGALPYTRVVNFNPTVEIARSINAK